MSHAQPLLAKFTLAFVFALIILVIRTLLRNHEMNLLMNTLVIIEVAI